LVGVVKLSISLKFDKKEKNNGERLFPDAFFAAILDNLPELAWTWREGKKKKNKKKTEMACSPAWEGWRLVSGGERCEDQPNRPVM
jgi:hypothetical protein